MNNSCYFLCIFSILLCLTSCAKPPQTPAPPSIIPQPVSIIEQDGWFEIIRSTEIGVENEGQQVIANGFFEHFQTVANWTPEISIDNSGDIIFRTKENLDPEGYELSVTEQQIIISASSDAGYFYALQSLRQLLPVEFVEASFAPKIQWTIPAVEINDAPRFDWRGFMLDVSRHFFEVEKVKTFLDHMAALKLNTFHWHLTDDQGWRIEIKQFPKLTEIGGWRVDYNDHDWSHNRWWGRPVATASEQATYGGFYTQDDIREVIAYAQERNITIIPEIDVPGHAQAIIASYPEVACHPGPYFVATGGAFKDNTLCPGKEVTFDFIEKVLNEVMDLFPSKYIHIGGDECNKSAWKVDPDCQRRMAIEGLKDEKELQSYFIQRVEKIINAKGKSLIGWDEILEGGLAPNATVMSWRGENGGIEAATQGHQIIMTPNEYSYFDLKQGHTDHEPNLGYSQCLLSTCYNYNPLPQRLASQSDLILGIQGNLWSESLPEWDQATYMTFPRLFALAENAWSPQASENWNGFIDRLYPQLCRLEKQNVRYAKSAFNVWINHKGMDKSILIDMNIEANGLDIRYTLDGSDPDLNSKIYNEPFPLEKTALIKAAAFRNQQIQGDITQKQFHVHSAAKTNITYHTSFLKNKNGGGTTALTDLNYGSNWVVDSLWQGFRSSEVELDVIFNEVKQLESVQMNFLQVAISGIYMPKEISILGTKDGNTFSPLATSALEEALIQGRYIHREKMKFEKQSLKGIKVILQAVNPIPETHHRSNELSNIYMDEIIIY